MRREIKSLAKSFKNAFCGIAAVIRHERNFRIHICMMLYVLFFSVVGEVERADVSRFILCFGIVFAAELVNTALELVCDEMTTEYNARIRDIKDIAAGAVLICAIASAAVGLMVFLSHDVFWRVMEKLVTMPWLLAAFLVSVPIAILFIIKRGK